MMRRVHFLLLDHIERWPVLLGSVGQCSFMTFDYISLNILKKKTGNEEPLIERAAVDLYHEICVRITKGGK